MILTPEYLKKIKLNSRPIGQVIIGKLLLLPNYRFFSKVKIILEGLENIPRNETVIFAMNHTDRYNYWPFQYKLWEHNFYYTTVWVKANYYKYTILSYIFKMCNLIPIPSMKFLIKEFYQLKFKKEITKNDLSIITNNIYNINYLWQNNKIEEQISPEMKIFIKKKWVDYLKEYYNEIMHLIFNLSNEALFKKKLNLIIFPEGTRSLKFKNGKTGIAKLALVTGKKVIPVACNNSEIIYQNNLPFARSGQIVYKIGKPISVKDKFALFQIKENLLQPFSLDAQIKFNFQFKEVTKLIMQDIYQMLDKKYIN